MNSFDLDTAARTQARMSWVDYPEDVDAAIEATEIRLRRINNRLMGWSMAYGCAIGILATLAVQHIFGAA